jgi:hypothetical protein
MEKKEIKFIDCTEFGGGVNISLTKEQEDYILLRDDE